MEVTFPRNGTHAAATPMILPGVLAVVDFPEVVEGVTPLVVAEDVGGRGLWRVNAGVLLENDGSSLGSNDYEYRSV